MSQKEQVKEEVQPNAVVVAMPVVQAVLKHLDTQPRGVVNKLAIALEQSRPVHIKEGAAPVAVDQPEAKAVVAK